PVLDAGRIVRDRHRVQVAAEHQPRAGAAAGQPADESGRAGKVADKLDRHPDVGQQLAEALGDSRGVPCRAGDGDQLQAGVAQAAGVDHQAGTTGSTTCEGCSEVCRTVWWATSIRVPVATSSPVLRLRLKRGKLLLVTSSRIQ